MGKDWDDSVREAVTSREIIDAIDADPGEVELLRRLRQQARECRATPWQGDSTGGLPEVPPQYAARVAEIQAEVDARNAAEAEDLSLLWRRLGREAARSAVLAERVVPPEGVAAFRAAFDEALPQARAEDPLGRT